MLLTDYYSDHAVFIESARRMLQRELAPHVTEWEDAGYYPDSVYETLGANGFLGLLVPEEYGGIGTDLKLAAAWCEVFGELPSVGMTVGVNMHSVVVCNALAKYGTEEAKRRWLPSAVEGKAIGAYAFTEPGAGSDLARLRTTAQKVGEEWVINGAKTFITNGARASFILVLTRTDPSAGYAGFTTFVVDTKSPGFKVVRTLDKLGWRASDTAELYFENVRVPESAILGKVGEGWRQASRSLNWERLMLTLTALGGGRECFKQTVRYASERESAGRPLRELPVIADLLTQMQQKVVEGEALSHLALDELLLGREGKVTVSLAKRKVCDDMVWLADQAIQIHGGYGYTKEFLPERWWRDLRLMPIGGGTSQVMANIVAKELQL